MITRRVLMAGGALGALAVASGLPRLFAGVPAQAAGRDATVYPVSMSSADWQKRLTPAQFDVLREEGTERPFTSPLLHEARHGTFTCAGCDQALFASTTKFDSHTGWPSFWAPLDGAVVQKSDGSFMMMRTAVNCSRCGGHLGHVFNDGPKPTGLRYCMNGVALGFRAEAA